MITNEKVKVLIVDDSATMQNILKKIIQNDSRLEVIGIANNGEEALKMISKKRPDVITMDLFMPILDGFSTTKKIMSSNPIPIIIISGGYKKEDVQLSFKAMEAGAITIMEKPPGLTDPNFQYISRRITSTIFCSAEIKLVTRRFPKPLQQSESKIHTRNRSDIKAIAIGASLGGPQAVRRLLSELNPSSPVPIFVVQHISPGFTQGYAEWLNHSTPLRVVIPSHGEKPMGGTVYIAPDNKHMTIDKFGNISLSDTATLFRCKPSVSVLFASVADFYGKQSIGVLLTGMGDDGSKELLTLKEKGSITIAQNKATSLAFGMPGTAIQLGGAKHVLSIEEIAPFINQIIN
ncbi:MAG: chemotaxis-specific protein-glutamate methyltransferase CheB [Chlamydiota bacterium]|nr:chemotaxis-specific protein-glutamate methyltransferase CheB [Chlamydiota bacterium]